MRNLQRERFFDPRNPRGTLFRAGRPIANITNTYYLVHENPYQRSCWGTMQKNEKKTLRFFHQNLSKSSTVDENPCRFF